MVQGEDGNQLPLVRSERTLFQSTEETPPAEPPSWLPIYLITGLAIGGTALGLGSAARSNRPARMAFIVVALTWVLLTAVGGVVLAGLWALTDHAAAYNNENVLQADLLALPLLWLIPRLVFGSRSTGRRALVVAGIVAGLSLLGLVLKLLPQFYQVNGAVIALALPAHAGVAAGIWRLLRAQDPRTRRTASRASA
jgi:hypothetical protein